MRQPSTQNVYDLFNGRVQFQVPVYQRSYVWNEEENWEVLWDDIADTAGRYLEKPEGATADRHFLGPIVLSQEHFDTGTIDRRLVIDGQQRLTTLQILLSAAAAAAADVDEGISDELAELVENRGRSAKGDWRYKVWPSRRDRAAFKATLAKEAEKSDDALGTAWRFFNERVREWIGEEREGDPAARTTRLEALQVCLEELLYVVSINLDAGDNAQVIFETLNARGTGLGALDLVKNATFLQAEREKAPAAELNDDLWEPTFEADGYWLEEVRQGRERRSRSDWFLMHWLALELGDVVRADKLFDRFRKDLLHSRDARPMAELVPRLCADARTMRSFERFEPGSPEGLFFSRLETLDTTTMLPVALFLFRTDELEPARRLRALRALESWLVRRAILRLTPKSYNRTLAGLIKAMKADAARADEALVRELGSSQAQTALWPSDTEVRRRLEEGGLYGYVGQPRVRMLLEACELDMRDSPKTEEVALPAALSIEHALPRSWQENWPVDGAADVEAATEDRESHVHRLGNLTLVTTPLNSSLSAAPWQGGDGSGKRAELMKRSVLLINQSLCENEEWNEALIDRRGADLASRILRTWPGPEDPAWGVEPAPSTGAAGPDTPGP